jgi:hypothetical protein
MTDGSGVMISAVGGAAEIYFWPEKDTRTNLEFEPTSNGKLEEP